MKHTLSVLLENKPGALARIATMFARRGFNIESLAVGPTEHHDVSRSRCASTAPTHDLDQIEKQIHKLVNVLRVTRARVRRIARARALPDQGDRAAEPAAPS